MLSKSRRLGCHFHSMRIGPYVSLDWNCDSTGIHRGMCFIRYFKRDTCRQVRVTKFSNRGYLFHNSYEDKVQNFDEIHPSETAKTHPFSPPSGCGLQCLACRIATLHIIECRPAVKPLSANPNHP